MKNYLKRNSQKVNVSACASLDCSEKQADKEIEIYKPISEDPIKVKTQTKAEDESSTAVTVKDTSLNGGDIQADKLIDGKMVQDAVNDGADEQMLRVDDKDKDRKQLAEKHDEVKFIKGDYQNGDAKIDITSANGAGFSGLTKEELMKYAEDPFWVRLRWILFVGFWLVWIAMLVGAIWIIFNAPKCAAPEPLLWYKRSLLTKFKASNSPNDNNVAERMNAGGVIYELPAALTYDIRKPEVEEQIKNIVDQYKKNEVNVIMDVTANYVPKESHLVSEALASPEKRSAFIWMKSATPPNNWLSLVNGSAWWQIEKGNYVLSQFGNGLYDLHMNDSVVKKEFGEVLRHLISLGVRGIRLKNTKFYILTKTLKDEVPGENLNYDLSQYGFWTHSQSTFQDGLGDVLYEYRAIVKNASADAFLTVAEDVIRPEAYRTSTGQMGIDMPMYGRFVGDLLQPKNKSLEMELQNILQRFGDKSWLQWNLADLSYKDSTVDVSAVLYFLSMLPGTIIVPDLPTFYNISDTAYHQIQQLRVSPSYMHGELKMLDTAPLLSYTRLKPGNPGYLVIFNPTAVALKGNFSQMDYLPDKMSLQMVSNNINSSYINTKSNILIKDMEILPFSTFILSYVPIRQN